MTRGGEATRANVVRNARAERDRLARWTATRDQCWAFVGPLIRAGADVAIVGAGKGHTVPLRRIGERAGRLTLIDLDPTSARAARRRIALRQRRRVDVIEHDVTGGLADRIVGHARDGSRVDVPAGVALPLPGAPYDVVIGDLLYTQLVYPGLLDAGLPQHEIRATLTRTGQPLVDLVVARIHASIAPDGVAVHLHDPISWRDDRPQPVLLASILEAGSTDRALQLLHAGTLVGSGDVRASVLNDPRVEIAGQARWRWPFSPEIDYLVWAIATRPRGPATG